MARVAVEAAGDGGESATNAMALAIVTFNSASVLPGLLDSLPTGLGGMQDAEVFVVDNESGDDSVAIAQSHPVAPHVIRMGRNAGYAAGINAAAAMLKPQTDLLVLNPDIRLMPGAALAMSRALRRPGVGAVAPRVLHEDGTTALSLRREPSVLSAWSEALLGGRVSGWAGTGETVRDAALYAKGGRIEWATGAVVAISAQARAAVGAWDESFFLYSEEVDYFRRLRAAGFSAIYCPEACATHIGGDYRVRPSLSALLTANRIRYHRRNHGRFSNLLFRAGIAAGSMIRAGWSPGQRAALRAAMGYS